MFALGQIDGDDVYIGTNEGEKQPGTVCVAGNGMKIELHDGVLWKSLRRKSYPAKAQMRPTGNDQKCRTAQMTISENETIGYVIASFSLET